MPLLVALVITQALDLLTFLQDPQLESNPIVAAIPVPAAIVLKVAGTAAIVLIARRLSPTRAQAALAVAIAVASFGVGANVASLAR